MRNNFSSSILYLYSAIDPLVTCPDITFQVTDDCCLNCSYCYQINKSHRMMTKDTIKQIIDLLFQMYDENREDTVINHHTKGLVLSFIGGEPFMNIETIDYGSQYFLDECKRRNHIWLTNFKFSIDSNGILFFEPKVQEYLQKFKPFINLNITLDGPKEFHDQCRVDKNGTGSFDRVLAAFKASQQIFSLKPHTKVTISPENLPYLDKIVEFFLEQNCKEINANPIFEHKWTIEESQLYYIQLKKIADIVLKESNIDTNLFSEYYGLPMISTDNNNYCGGTGFMLAFDPEGKAYPCLRYMESSLGDTQPPLLIGNMNGIYNTQEYKELYKDMRSVTRKSQSTEECFNCPVASGCSWCSAWNYQETGSYNKRSINICWMHRAQCLANAYYYNLYYNQINSEKRHPIYIERNIANKIISDEEYDKLLELSFNN